MEVFQERIAEQISIVGLSDDRGNRGFAGELGSAQAALTHDQLVAGLGLLSEELLELRGAPLSGNATNDDGLKNADLLDGSGELLQVVLIENLSRLLRVGDDLIDGNFSEGRAGHRQKLMLIGCFT